MTTSDITEQNPEPPEWWYWGKLQEPPVLNSHPFKMPPRHPCWGFSSPCLDIQLPALILQETQTPEPLPSPCINELLGMHTWYSKVVSPWAPSGPRAARRSLSRCRACCRTHRATARATSSPATPARATRVRSTDRMGEVLWAGRGRTAAASSLCGNKVRIKGGSGGGGRLRSCSSPLSHTPLPARMSPGEKLRGSGTVGTGRVTHIDPRSFFLNPHGTNSTTLYCQRLRR